MLNERVDLLIKKYHIYESVKDIGDTRQVCQSRWKRWINMSIGLLQVAFLLNKAIFEVKEKKIAVCPGDDKKWFKTIWRLILPQMKNKICCFIVNAGEEKSFEGYSNLQVISFQEINRHPVQVVFVFSLQSMYTANLCSSFEGKIEDLRSVVFNQHLEKYFFASGWLTDDPYSEIYIANIFRNKTSDETEKKIWHQRLIAYYLWARDFLGVQREIYNYSKMGYDDVGRYCEFWNELEVLFKDIKEKLSARKQNDVFVFWLDQIEKKDFYSMPWLGGVPGRIFHRAYTTMVSTTAVLYSILTNKNVKKENLMKYRNGEIINSIFSQEYVKGRKVYFSGAKFQSKGVERKYVFPCYDNTYGDAPVMIGMWYALDILYSTSDTCAIFFHSMETHNNYKTAVSVAAEGNRQEKENGVSLDFFDVAKKSREYLDSQLKWYSHFLPANSTSIYMSDHGGNFDLSEKNINIPFKIVGKGIAAGDEFRLFSHKNLGLLIYGLMSDDKIIDKAFSKEVVIDVIDTYTRDVMQRHKEVIHDNWLIEYKKVKKDELSKYIQTTKVVTDRDEYYTINILGEETYYIGKDFQHNMARDSSHANRVAELREIAGKFCNPWKEKKQVAIEFYEYLGIEEKDILNQCY